MTRDAVGPAPIGKALPEGTERQLRLGELMLRAAALETVERDAFLERTLQDPALVSEVRRRLAAVAEALPSSFLAEPTGLAAEAMGALDALDDEEPEVAMAAEERYELGELLGEGGMARVVRARDRQLRRTVAIKLFDADTSRLSGALREARAQAQVHHPNVLEVYETGELGDERYIAMQYVEGGTLGEVAEGAPLEEVVRLMIGVAEGLHAAHRQGLVHRDVKPSNILVGEGADGRAVPYVGDFGIASDRDGSGASLLGLVAGTPAYMSAEQLEGRPLDRRADVYGLGVTLYRLFTGRLPFVAESTEELVETILSGSFAPPREVAPSFPPELEAIVLRAMARAPEERYPTAQALADDLRRYLDGEVVEAYAAGLAYRLTRWGLRNRRLLSVAGVFGFLLVVALAVAAFFGAEAIRANDKVRHRQVEAEKLVGFMLDDLRQRLDAVGRLDILDGVSAEALRYFRQIPDDELSDDELARRSQALYQIGEVELLAGAFEAAVAPLEESLALARTLAARDPENEQRLYDLGQSQFWVGYVHWEQGHGDDARPYFEAYLETSEELVRRDSGRLEWQRELGYAHSNLGSFHQSRCELEAARRRFAQTLEIERVLMVARPGDLDAKSDLSGTYNALGLVELSLGSLDRAAELFEADLALQRELLDAEPDHFRWREHYAASLTYLADLRLLQGRSGDALEHWAEIEATYRELTEHDPENSLWRYQLGLAWLGLGRARWAAGESRGARELWRRLEPVAADLATQGVDKHRWLWAAARIVSRWAEPTSLQGPQDRMIVAAIEDLADIERGSSIGGRVEQWKVRGHLMLAARSEARGDSAVARAHLEAARNGIDTIGTECKTPTVSRLRAMVLKGLGESEESSEIRRRLHSRGIAWPDELFVSQPTQGGKR